MTLSTPAVQHADRSASIASLRSLPDRRRVVVREERSGDRAAREALLDAAMGAERIRKTSERLREGRVPARGLALIATVDGKIVGTVRLWHVCDAAGLPALLLGPLAVSQDHRELGIGGMLMREAIARATAHGHRAILLVGDAPYYERFGFSATVTRALDMPGPVDRNRFLGLELQAGALEAAHGGLSGCLAVPLAAPAAARDVRRAA